MKDQFQDLYAKLLHGLYEIEQNGSDPETRIASCFHLCESTRRQVDDIVQAMAFPSEEAEIFFFKTVKPPFTLLVEFYSILYRTTLFVPDDKADRRRFWEDELQRVNTFLQKHAGLLEYINSGSTDHDREYFLRTSDSGVSALHDELVAKILARQKYLAYVQERLQAGADDLSIPDGRGDLV